MCGICGIVSGARERTVERPVLERMCRVLEHRGPDDEGIVIRGSVGLGHRRLSIVDLAGGHQPMANEDGTVWVSYNGEIYNHLELRPGLEAAGHRYRTRSDTETLVHLYEALGWPFVRRLRGIFALALWDERQRTLVLARDPMGVKPLYYATTRRGDLVFASEIKALLVAGVAAALDEPALPEYFANGFLAGDRTLFRGVRKLPPGTVLCWHDGRIEQHAYWTPEDWPSNGAGFWPRFASAVESQLMSDAPLGVFLSGGLDSSLVVAAMRARGVARISTFSVGYTDAAANELPQARAVARHFETDAHEIVLDPADFFAQLPALTWQADVPLRFPASAPLYAVSRLAREAGVKVVLAGEGSDELFAGYGRYARGLINLRAGELYARVGPEGLRRAIRERIARLGDRYVSSRLKRSFLGRRSGFVDGYLEAFSVFAGAHRAALLPGQAGVDAYAAERDVLDAALYSRNPLEALLRFDQATYLEELLVKQDKMSMAASVESRVPFLDQGIVAWAAGLAPDQKLRRGRGKQIVRAAARGRLPDAVLRGPKRGFLVPLASWLRGPGRAWLEEYVPRPDEAPLDRRYVQRLMREHAAGIDHTDRLWLVLAFQVWRRLMTTGAPPRPVRGQAAGEVVRV
jgi:asparagine synthase (glutamine-hydrolysing)